MNQKGFALLPVILWVVGSIAAISVLTSVTTPENSTETQILDETTQTQYNQPVSNQDLTTEDGEYIAETYDQTDPVVQCNFKSGTRQIKQSECSQMVDCQIGDKWIPAAKDKCTEAQGMLAKGLEKAIKARITQSLLDSAETYHYDSLPIPAPTEASKVNVYGKSGSYTQIGNTLFGSEGDNYTRIGSTLFGSEGDNYTQIGSTLFGNDGSSYQKIGNTTFGSDGTSYTQIGNTTFGSDGSSATQIGNTTFISP